MNYYEDTLDCLEKGLLFINGDKNLINKSETEEMLMVLDPTHSSAEGVCYNWQISNLTKQKWLLNQ